MQIRRTRTEDVPAVMEVIEDARESLRLAGIPQWQNGYPNAETILNDIRLGYSWLMEEEGRVIGTCAIIAGRDPNYAVIENGEWLNDEDYTVIHRIALRSECKGKHLAAVFFDHAAQIARDSGYRNVRADTHEINHPMQKALRYSGFVPCGRVYMADGAPRTGFQKVLEEIMKETLQKLHTSDKVQKALQFIEQDADHVLDQQIELALIPAYSNHEKQKADRFRQMIEEMGYETIQDEVCNTFAVIRGPENSPVVMVSAHLDTVFPMDTELKLRRDGNRICIPGICDDTRGCAEVLAILRAMKEADIRPACTLIIGGDAGEEGVGNFAGMRHIFEKQKQKVDAFISIDGCGNSLTYGAMSDVQYRITFRGPGGHSAGAFGLVNPIMCMGRTIARIAEERVPADPWTIFNVSTVSGGTGVTSIASECSLTMDVRSADAGVMKAFHEKCLAIARECAEEEYRRWEDVRRTRLEKGEKLRFDPEAQIEISTEEFSGSIGGIQDENCEIVTILKAAFEAAGAVPEMRSLSSTDANIPLSLGIPAATIGSGGASGGTHDISEWYDPTDAWKGVQKNLLCVLALTGAEGITLPLISKTQTV